MGSKITKAMDFSYKDYATIAKKKKYPNFFESPIFKDRLEFETLLRDYRKSKMQLENVLDIMKERTTSNYFDKVFKATTNADSYSEKVFPLYKYILPDAMIDDWLSTVDPHNIKHPARDHSLHQTLTAYIVGKMLGYGDVSEGLMIGKKSLLQRCAEILHSNSKADYLRAYVKRIDKKFDVSSKDYDMDWAVQVVYETAIIAALFHDMGYPWQFVNKLSSKIEGAIFDKVNGLPLDAKGAMKVMTGRLLLYPFYGYDVAKMKAHKKNDKRIAMQLIEKGLMESHGMPGALSFMSLNRRVDELTEENRRDRATFKLILDWAALAIMMHDMPKHYWGNGKESKTPENPILRLDFEKDPISCIISIADILEEFNRPCSKFKHIDENAEKKIDEHVRVNYDYACGSSELEINGKDLTVRYYYESEEEKGNHEEHRKDEVFEYLDEKVGYIDLSSWGVEVKPCEVGVKK